MKYQLNQLLQVGFLLLASIVAVSCSDNDKIGTDVMEVLDTNLIKNSEAFQLIVEQRTSTPVFTITDVQRDGHLLSVKIAGASPTREFEVIWDGRIAESYPMQVWLVVAYKQGQDVSTIQTTETALTINLSKILSDKVDLNDFAFNVINGSKQQKVTIDKNGVVFHIY